MSAGINKDADDDDICWKRPWLSGKKGECHGAEQKTSYIQNYQVKSLKTRKNFICWVFQCRPVWRNGCYEHLVCSIIHILKWGSNGREALSVRHSESCIPSLKSDWLKSMTPYLVPASLRVRDNSSHFSSSHELGNSTQGEWSHATPQVSSLLPMPRMIFIL